MYAACAFSAAFVSGWILIWYPPLVTAWCDSEGTLHGGSALHCVAGAVVGIALEHSSLRAWRFFERAGARGLTDLSSVQLATKSHA